MSNPRKSSHKQTATAKALAGSETRNATQKGSRQRPPKSPKNSKRKRPAVSDEESDSSNDSSPPEHQHTSKKKTSKRVRKGKAPALPVDVEEVHDLASTGSEPEVVEHDSCTEDSGNDEDEASKRTLYKFSVSSPVCTIADKRSGDATQGRSPRSIDNKETAG